MSGPKTRPEEQALEAVDEALAHLKLVRKALANGNPSLAASLFYDITAGTNRSLFPFIRERLAAAAASIREGEMGRFMGRHAPKLASGFKERVTQALLGDGDADDDDDADD